MSLSSGTKLGPYEILSKIGVGGMGEVDRARDTRLERTEAIKVLTSEMGGGAFSPLIKQGSPNCLASVLSRCSDLT